MTNNVAICICYDNKLIISQSLLNQKPKFKPNIDPSRCKNQIAVILVSEDLLDSEIFSFLRPVKMCLFRVLRFQFIHNISQNNFRFRIRIICFNQDSQKSFLKFLSGRRTLPSWPRCQSYPIE